MEETKIEINSKKQGYKNLQKEVIEIVKDIKDPQISVFFLNKLKEIQISYCQKDLKKQLLKMLKDCCSETLEKEKLTLQYNEQNFNYFYKIIMGFQNIEKKSFQHLSKVNDLKNLLDKQQRKSQKIIQQTKAEYEIKMQQAEQEKQKIMKDQEKLLKKIKGLQKRIQKKNQEIISFQEVRQKERMATETDAQESLLDNAKISNTKLFQQQLQQQYFQEQQLHYQSTCQTQQTQTSFIQEQTSVQFLIDSDQSDFSLSEQVGEQQQQLQPKSKIQILQQTIKDLRVKLKELKLNYCIKEQELKINYEEQMDVEKEQLKLQINDLEQQLLNLQNTVQYQSTQLEQERKEKQMKEQQLQQESSELTQQLELLQKQFIMQQEQLNEQVDNKIKEQLLTLQSQIDEQQSKLAQIEREKLDLTNIHQEQVSMLIDSAKREKEELCSKFKLLLSEKIEQISNLDQQLQMQIRISTQNKKALEEKNCQLQQLQATLEKYIQQEKQLQEQLGVAESMILQQSTRMTELEADFQQKDAMHLQKIENQQQELEQKNRELYDAQVQVQYREEWAKKTDDLLQEKENKVAEFKMINERLQEELKLKSNESYKQYNKFREEKLKQIADLENEKNSLKSMSLEKENQINYLQKVIELKEASFRELEQKQNVLVKEKQQQFQRQMDQIKQEKTSEIINISFEYENKIRKIQQERFHVIENSIKQLNNENFSLLELKEKQIQEMQGIIEQITKKQQETESQLTEGHQALQKVQILTHQIEEIKEENKKKQLQYEQIRLGLIQQIKEKDITINLLQQNKQIKSLQNQFGKCISQQNSIQLDNIKDESNCSTQSSQNFCQSQQLINLSNSKASMLKPFFISALGKTAMLKSMMEEKALNNNNEGLQKLLK